MSNARSHRDSLGKRMRHRSPLQGSHGSPNTKQKQTSVFICEHRAIREANLCGRWTTPAVTKPALIPSPQRYIYEERLNSRWRIAYRFGRTWQEKSQPHVRNGPRWKSKRKQTTSPNEDRSRPKDEGVDAEEIFLYNSDSEQKQIHQEHKLELLVTLEIGHPAAYGKGRQGRQLTSLMSDCKRCRTVNWCK